MEYRKFLKNPIITEESDQQKGLPVPPIQKSYPEEAKLIDLIPPKDFKIGSYPLLKAITNRRSQRKFTDEALTLEELSFLLWCTQGVKELIRNNLVTLRTVPSGGGMHPFETYLLINRVEGIESGLYRYLAIEHKLLLEKIGDPTLSMKIGEACNNQTFVGKGAVVFIWSARPYRTEYRYGEDSLKDILMSVGHICQNLYLACESIKAGTCSIVAYQQDKLDKFIGVDGYEEISLYVAPVGRI
ncbi:MAG TPA: SagB/ThcOx family dehydrogenase [candidate division Zixibacteria bacterium]|nr:SagB/ThcOx family dehydrogenase [candidate division Zixibacteria bacterium]